MTSFGDVVAVLVALAFVAPAIVKALRRAIPTPPSPSGFQAQAQPQVAVQRPVAGPAPAPAAYPPPPQRRAAGPAPGAPAPLGASPRSRPGFADALANPGQIRSAVILAEVLGPPVSMR